MSENQLIMKKILSSFCLLSLGILIPFASVAQALMVSTTSTTVSCSAGSDGTATANASGGMTPYTYLWSVGLATSQTVTGLAAGSYSVTVSDALGAFRVALAQVTDPAPVVISTQVVDVSSPGASDGSISTIAFGGTAPYSYVWSNGATGSIINNLLAGTYCVTLTDANACSYVDCAIVGQAQSTITLSISTTDVTCNGGNDGSISLSATGGSSPYTFSWSNGLPSLSTQTGLSTGSYSVTVTDAIGASSVGSAVLLAPPAITITLAVTDESGPGMNDGSISSNVSGGIAPYTYNWNSGISSSSISNLSAGTYCVTIIDQNACTASSCGTVNQSSTGPVANIIITEIMYNPPESGTDSLEFIELYNHGSTSVNLSGYTFTQGINHTFSSGSIAPNQYFVIAVDSNAHFNVFGQKPDAEWTSGGLSNSGEDIALHDNLGRQVDSVDYDDNSPWPSGSSAGNPDGGGSSIELSDVNLDNNLAAGWNPSASGTGVIINGNVVVASPGAPNLAIGLKSFTVENTFQFFPNPSNGMLFIKLQEKNSAQIIQLFNLEGRLMLEEQILNQKQLDLSALPNGMYTLRLGNSMKKLIIQH